MFVAVVMLVSVTVVGVVGVVGGGVGRGERGRERFGVLVTERRCRFIPYDHRAVKLRR